MHFNPYNVDIDLRENAFGLINEFGIDMLYVRNCKFVRCKCFNDLHKTGDPNCPLCMGLGYFASIQKVRSFESAYRSYLNANEIVQAPLGVTDQKKEVYYLEYKYNPKERDMLLKVTWDKKKNPVDVIEVLEIANIYEMRGNNGRLEVVGCLIDKRTDLKDPYNKYIKNLSKKGISQILNNGKYIWPALQLNTTRPHENS